MFFTRKSLHVVLVLFDMLLIDWFLMGNKKYPIRLSFLLFCNSKNWLNITNVIDQCGIRLWYINGFRWVLDREVLRK